MTWRIGIRSALVAAALAVGPATGADTPAAVLLPAGPGLDDTRTSAAGPVLLSSSDPATAPPKDRPSFTDILTPTPKIELRGRIEADAVLVGQSAASQAQLGTLQDGYGFRRARLGPRARSGIRAGGSASSSSPEATSDSATCSWA